MPNDLLNNAWLYYFSALAQTVAAGTSLFIAVAVIRYQWIAMVLQDYKSKLALLFSEVAQLAAFHKIELLYAADHDWSMFLDRICKLADDADKQFAVEDNFLASREYFELLVIRCDELSKALRALRRTLELGILGTIVISGGAVLVIPLVIFHMPVWLLIASWLGSGSLCLLLVGLSLYYLWMSFSARSTRFAKT